MILANIYANVLNAAGFDGLGHEVGSRNLYLEALKAGSRSRSFPEYLATVTEFIEGDDANAVASGDVAGDARRRSSRWPRGRA